MKKINPFVVVRIMLGLLFVVSGFEKVTHPYQNFLYVVQSYEIFNSSLEKFIAQVLPWVEFFIGIFLILGFWLRMALKGFMVMMVAFIFIVAQALVRQLPILECGCFGELISFPLHVTLFFDVMLLFCAGLLWLGFEKTSQFSLDNRFQ